ncbi:MAG: WG repeat-containing protein [Bacteroidales bacterium]|nr:WG repeat-containing protein [Bacteroidales bacterium]
MKKLAFIILLLFPTLAKTQSNLTLSEAKEIANTYYGSFQQMSKHPVGEIQAQSGLRIMNVIGKDVNGNSLANDFRVPNDLVEVGGKHEDKRTMSLTNYIGVFLRIAEEKKLDFSYKVLSDEYQRGPEMSRGNDIPPFVRIVVQKTIKTPDSPTIVLNDTMFLHSRNKNVCSIKNQFSSSGLNYEDMTTDQLLVEAQTMYSNKHYEEAYRLYQKVLKKDPKNEDASYSLGVMSFKGEGCKQYPRKVRDYLVDFYWQKSNKGIEQLVLNHNRASVVLKPLSGWESNPFPSNRLFAFNFKSGKLGYISAQGKMVIKQQYQYGYPFFTNGTAIVKSDKNEWFLIDTTGKVKDVYLRVTDVEGGKQLLVHKEDKSGVINRKTGEWDVPLINKITAYIDLRGETKRYIVNKGGKYGMITSNNDMILPSIYDNLRSVDYEVDKITLLCNYDQSSYDQLLKRYEKDYKIPVDELKRIGTILKLDLPNFTNGLAIVEVLESDKREWQLMDTTGKVRDTFELLIGLGFENLDMVFHEFKKEGKYGLLWPDYRILLPAISKDIIMPVYYSGEDWVWFIYDEKEPAYSQLKKKYGSVEKIPENELKKAATLLKVDIKLKL